MTTRKKKRPQMSRNKALEAAQEYYAGFHAAMDRLKKVKRQRNVLAAVTTIELAIIIVGVIKYGI